MKRFYNLLSLFLLSIVGITSAVAQDYKKGTLLETTDEVVGKQVLLYAPGTSDDHPAGFMNGTNELCEIVSDSCIYVFEAVGRQVDGYDLYRLKQVGSGKYVKDADGQDEDAFELTDEVSEAFEMTVLPYVDITGTDERCGRNTASSQKQDLSNPGFVLCRGEMAAEAFEDSPNDGYIYIGSVHSPFISPYSDTNMWEIWTVENTKGLEKLNNYLDMYFPSPDLSFDFPAGNSPGYYQSEVVAEAQVLVDKANDVSNGDITMSDAEIDELCAQLKAAYEKLQESMIPLSEGYYFIYNVNGRYLYGADQGDTSFLYPNSANTYQIPENLSYKDLRYIWKVTPAEEGEDLYHVENVLKGLVISGQEASCSGTDNKMGFTLAKSGSVMITCDGDAEAASFIFSTTAPTKNGHKQFHAKFNDNPVMAWDNTYSWNNCMHFVAVTEEEVKAAIKQAKQIDCTVGAAGVGTLILPFAAELPQDMQAYRCTDVDGTRIQTEAVNEIPANVPLLITALPGIYQFTGVPEGTEKNYTDGVLTGVMEETVITSGYVMQQQQNVVAFYPVSAEKPITVPAYKCYLNYAGEQQAMRFDNVLTDLKGVTTSEGNSSLYDLQGRRTQTATAPGVYIQNNRKIVKFKK